MIRNALLILAIAILSGCAIVPDSVEVPEGTQLVSYSKAVTAGSDALGQTARWGGVIVGVENKPQKTWIEMVHFPLNHYGKPMRSEETIGRFKVAIEGFIDPITFEEGRSVTFLGTLASPSAGMIGEQPYMYPTIDGLDYHMWRKETIYDVSTLYFDFATGWFSPFYSPFYRPHWGIQRSRVRVIERSNTGPGSAVRSRGNLPNTIGNSRQVTERQPSERRPTRTQDK